MMRRMRSRSSAIGSGYTALARSCSQASSGPQVSRSSSNPRGPYLNKLSGRYGLSGSEVDLAMRTPLRSAAELNWAWRGMIV
jgi:hypothetical protein